MDDEDLREEEKAKMKIQEMFRDESTAYQPIIIKASQAGVLETVLQEAEKIIGN